MTSFRRSIMAWITVLLAVLGVVASAASYLLAKQEADKFLDAQLRQIAAHAGEGMSESAILQMTRLAEDEDELVIQIWDASGEMILRAASIELPRQSVLGFADLDVAGKSWRVYTASDGMRTSQVAQRWSARRELAEHAAFGAALPILAAIPVAWLVIIYVINRLLRRLSGFAEVLAKRSVDAKDPIALGGGPREIAPLNIAINALIERHQGAVDRQRRFVSDAAHELRTPLSALQIQVDNLRTHAESENNAQSETIDELKAGVRRASALVEQLLEMARLEDSATADLPRDIELRDVVSAAVADHIAIAMQKGVDLGLSVDDSPDFPLANREAGLLLANLVDNAVRYTPSGATVDVVLKRQGSDALIEVMDSGCGIPSAALPYIFDRFFRAAPADAEGTGLGLAIAKAIADRSGFGLTISNREDAGGVIARVRIPMAPAGAGLSA